MSGVGGFCCGPAVLIPPSEAATATHAYFKAMLVVLALYLVCSLFSAQWSFVLCDALVILMSRLMSSRPEGFSLYQLRSVLMLCVVRVIYSIYVAHSFYTRKIDTAPENIAGFYFYNLALLGGIIVYSVVLIVALVLHQQLQSQIAAAVFVPVSGFGPQPGAPGVIPPPSAQQMQPMGASSGDASSSATAGPAGESSQTPGFVPFAGQGHRL